VVQEQLERLALQGGEPKMIELTLIILVSLVSLLTASIRGRKDGQRPFSPTDTLPRRNWEYGNQISYWNDAHAILPQNPWAIGMHAGYLPGYPAPHGGIRLPEEMAVHFFKMPNRYPCGNSSRIAAGLWVRFTCR
jgi:hypothetical protein